jgi:hypothetical protein
MTAINGAHDLRVLILDACRNNPFAGHFRDVGRGLSRIEPPRGTVVFYAARDGTLAAEGDGADSPFAIALARHLTEPGVEVDKLFRRVIDDVLEATGNQQQPFLYGSLTGRQDFYFLPAEPLPSAAAPAEADAGASPSKDIDRLLDSAAPPIEVVRPVEPPSDNRAAPLVASVNDDGGGQAILVTQKAMLYEEPVNPPGGDANANAGVTALNAAVTWRYVENGANGPTIEANLQVPERHLKVKVTIHKNADKSLPASHLIEIQIDATPDFPGKGIKKVPRIVMKPTDEARGQPLVGADAKITDSFFSIALSAWEADISANLALLREREWIDLPFVYGTGQRAILTFEKGDQGDQVFQKAMTAWAAG